MEPSTTKYSYKVGDIVEGDNEGRWVLGKIVKIMNTDDPRLYISVSENKLLKADVYNLHSCEGATAIGKGWILKASDTKYAKSYIVHQLLKEL